MEAKLGRTEEVLDSPLGVVVLMSAGAELIHPESFVNLPKEISQNPILVEEAGERVALLSRFDEIFTKISDPTVQIDEALRRDVVSSSEIASLYDSISDFLERDSENRRFLLYFPFEMLPNLNNFMLPEGVKSSALRFRDVYINNWIMLLHDLEPRANFVDGDVLEPGLGEPERISKAGHFVPELLAKGFISIEDIYLLANALQNKALLRSLAEGIRVASDRGLISSFDLENLGGIIEKKRGDYDSGAVLQPYFFDPNSNLISPERAKWLLMSEEEKRIEQDAVSIAQKIVEGVSVEELINSCDAKKVGVLGVIEAGKQLAKTNPEKLHEVIEEFEAFIRDSKLIEDPGVVDVLLSGLSQWVRFGIVEEGFLNQFGLKLIDLSLPSSFTQEEISRDFKNLKIAAKKIQEHPFLSQKLFPVFLIFGSRLKGYAMGKSDLDVAMIFRPEATYDERMGVLEVIRKDVEELSDLTKVLEFWTYLSNGEIAFRSFGEDTRTFVNEDQVHLLMGGVWMGYGSDFMKVYQDMVEGYLDLSRFGDKKNDIRGQMLGQIELDTLQYRLMHKGYRRFYPLVDRAKDDTLSLIDWKSDFWEPGFRRIATKLFLTRVFLPDLSSANIRSTS